MTNLVRERTAAGRWKLVLLMMVLAIGTGLIVAGGLAAGGPDRLMIVAGSVLNALATAGASGWRGRGRR